MSTQRKTRIQESVSPALTLGKIARDLKKDERTIRRWAETGKLFNAYRRDKGKGHWRVPNTQEMWDLLKPPTPQEEADADWDDAWGAADSLEAQEEKKFGERKVTASKVAKNLGIGRATLYRKKMHLVLRERRRILKIDAPHEVSNWQQYGQHKNLNAPKKKVELYKVEATDESEES